VGEGAQSWRELLIDIKQRGLEIAPDLAVGDGALDFWKASGISTRRRRSSSSAGQESCPRIGPLRIVCICGSRGVASGSA
jgi:hypothetical protein